MAGDWIKMRGGLMQHPRLIALGRHLMRSREFREWLTPGGSGPLNGQLVSDDALRCVTCALLLRVWSASREYGKFDGDNLVLAHLDIPDIDLMAGCPGVGKAMAAVGWARVKDGDHGGVVLPNFRQHNAPMTPAEKQSAYRNRKHDDEQATKTVTDPLPEQGNKTVTREEKRRVKTETPSESCPEPPKPAASGPPVPSEPPILIFPAVGNGAKEWHLTKQKLGEWAEAFPGVDVAGECRKARQWCIDNPTRRKTAKGMPSFLLKWLGRSQNSSPRSPTNQSAPARFQTPEQREIDQMARYAEDALGIKK